MRSRRSVQRARLRRKKPDAVTQESSTCPSPEEKGRCGHAGEFNGPGCGGKGARGSRRGGQRARLRKQKCDAVTQERSTCPRAEEKAGCGHAGEFNVHVSGRKSPMRSRRRVQRARLREKIGEVVMLGCSTCPSPEEKARCGHAGEFNVPVSGGKSLMRSRKSFHRARFHEKRSEEVAQELLPCPMPKKATKSHARALTFPPLREKYQFI